MDTVKTMNSLKKEYGEGIISMAMAHLFYVGKNALESADVDALVAETRRHTDETDLITTEVQERILRCAKEMSNLEIEEILRYIKVDYHMYDVSVQEGKVIEFLKNATDEHVLHVVVPSETTDEAITDAVNMLDQAIEKYGVSHDGDFSEFDTKLAIYSTLNQAKINPKSLDVYRSVYI